MKHKAIICDLDGTLSDLNGRNPYDASTCEDDLPHLDVMDYLDEVRHPVFLITGRMEKDRRPTEAWLTEYDVKYERLFMRPDGDTRKASIVKQEIYASIP